MDRRGGGQRRNCSQKDSRDRPKTGHLTREQIDEFRRAFEMFDTDNSGTISADELMLVLQNLNMKPRESEVEKIVRQIDTDGGGVIDFAEFLDLMNSKIGKLRRDEEVINAFRVFDRDRNGYITPAELKYAMNKMGHNVTTWEAEEMVREADTDGDGLINYKEFYEKMMK